MDRATSVDERTPEEVEEMLRQHLRGMRTLHLRRNLLTEAGLGVEDESERMLLTQAFKKVPSFLSPLPCSERLAAQTFSHRLPDTSAASAVWCRYDVSVPSGRCGNT
ncbi:hypothetical protein CYMTET_25058 [Cymbomonas tetramitiformis]|uniref:Uncharacterized protein n=1 Tax=Cymbomonas tetramitiformis TaxID=36881 RepID=A0AAE0FVC2_9CHLO|nr:hypothetical protein CYMTET_25058 [Cymbomonas tetramitiformis]